MSRENIARLTAPEGTLCQIYGWELTINLENSPHLLSGTVAITKRDRCNIPPNKLTTTTLCAGPYNVNGCEKDAGGPIVCDDMLYGLIDYRPPGCTVNINRLGTYIDISNYYDWISERNSSTKTVYFSGTIILFCILIMKIP